MLNGCLGPIFGWFIVKCLFSMIYYKPDAEEQNEILEAAGYPAMFYDLPKLKSEMQLWTLLMVGGAVVSFFF
jgi:hypothetical protein